MVAGPAIAQIIAQYEEASVLRDVFEKTNHHEQTPACQKSFLGMVQRLTTTLEEMGNPFQEESGELLSLDTKTIASSCNAAKIATHISHGNSSFKAFLESLRQKDTSSFYSPIKKTKMDFFLQEKITTVVKEKVLKEDCQLFSKLFISSQMRECNLQEFFRHENQSFPASLSDGGRLHVCQKSQLAAILVDKVTLPNTEPTADVIVVDGSALVNAVQPRNSKTFAEYAERDFIPKINSFTLKHHRIDIVFDIYKPSSLKAESRSKRGVGDRRRVTGIGKLPRNWHNFLRDSTNKTELFGYLADKVVEHVYTKTVVVTRGSGALSSNIMTDLKELSPCNHEEADTRLFLHVKDALKKGFRTVMVKANDTDVLVIAVATFSQLQTIGLQEMWLAFGQGQNMKWIAVHELKTTLGPEKCGGILFFHAFSGCDTVSAFRGKGKKSAWQTWDVCPEVSDVFSKLSRFPTQIDEEDTKTLEKFVVHMYDRSSSTECVDEARLELFSRKQRSYEAIPPTRAALVQHIRRAAYQSGCIWSQALECQLKEESPAKWGWKQEENYWEILWSELPTIAKSCQELTKCQCKTPCCGRCKCYKLGLSCTALCSCTC